MQREQRRRKTVEAPPNSHRTTISVRVISGAKNPKIQAGVAVTHNDTRRQWPSAALVDDLELSTPLCTQ